jgi:hypothetical protein
MKLITKAWLGLVAVAAFSIPAVEAAADTQVSVSAGQTWASIVAQHCRQGTQPAALAQYNRMSVNTPLRPGQRINIPASLSNARSASVQSTQGTVTVDGAAARRGQALAVGQTIATGAGSAADIVLDNGSVMRVGPNTRLRLDQLTLSGRSSNTSTNLQNGSVTMQVTRMNRDSAFTVSTVSAVAGVRGTYFYISYDENTRDVGVACYSGRVDVGRAVTGADGSSSIDPNGAVVVNAGHATTIHGDTGAVDTPFPIPGRIEWVDEE